MFVDRQKELAFLNHVLTRRRPGPAQLILLYGRRRVGKSHLLLHWAEQSGLPFTYWLAEKEPAALQRRKFFAKLQSVPMRGAPLFDAWSELWEMVATIVGDKRQILILDELPYAAESDPAFLSALQHAWDQYFQHTNVVIVLCGSQIRTMESLLFHQSPLFGRMTGQWHLHPLAFPLLTEFFPAWSTEELVATYAIVGGIPAYLKWLDADLNLVENIRQIILNEGSLFLAEPTFLLQDEVREPQSYLAILKAIGLGNHTLKEISNAALIASTHLSVHLKRLQELKIVERRLPATIPPSKRRNARTGRYHLSDPYFRFYFRFMAPFHDYLPFDPDKVLAKIKQELRAFVGQTTFEELARQWIQQQAANDQLPFQPDIVGQHWGRKVQLDVVAINWQARQILLGECKWQGDKIHRDVVRNLIEVRGPKLVTQLEGKWQTHYAFFSRSGFTPAATETATNAKAILVDLKRLAHELLDPFK